MALGIVYPMILESSVINHHKLLKQNNPIYNLLVFPHANTWFAHAYEVNVKIHVTVVSTDAASIAFSMLFSNYPVV